MSAHVPQAYGGIVTAQEVVMNQALAKNRAQLVALLNRWGGELTVAEQHEIQTHIEQLNAAEQAGQLVPDDLLYRADEIARYIEAARTRDALLTALLAFAGRYLSAAQLDQLRQIQNNLWQARQKGDLFACAAITEESDRDLKALGAPLLIVAQARTCVEQGRLSAALARRVRVALQDIDEGVNSDNDQRIRQGVTSLATMLDNVLRELEAAPGV
jgi:hypothetical protein